MERYYADHQTFYTGLQNLVLHLYYHFRHHYNDFGAVSNTSTFARDDLIKCELNSSRCSMNEDTFGVFSDVSTNRHGTRRLGDLITFCYGMDFALHNNNAVTPSSVD